MKTPLGLDVAVDIRRADHTAGQGHLAVRFCSVMAALLFLSVLIGFSRTFFLRPLFEVPSVPGYVFLHGAVLTAWFSGLLIQTALVAAKRTWIHRSFGWVVAAFGVAVVAITGPVILGLAPRQHAIGAVVDARVIRLVWLDLALLAGFALFFALGILMRQHREWHKRLMLLASITIVSPAVGRAWNLVPVLSGFNATFVTSVLALCLISLALHDLFSIKRIHWATISGAVLLMALRFVAPAIAATAFGQQFVRGLG